MSEIKKIEKLLDEYFVPREVWIGTDSTADRVDWVLRRKKMKETQASKRFDTFSDEFMVLAMLDNFAKEDLTVEEISKRSGLEIKTVMSVTAYLLLKGLVFKYHQVGKGWLYGLVEERPAPGSASPEGNV